MRRRIHAYEEEDTCMDAPSRLFTCGAYTHRV
jgi:hypothetical protein